MNGTELISLNDRGELAVEASEFIATVAQQKKDIEAADKSIRQKLLGVMAVKGIFNISNEYVSITMVCEDPKVKTEFDLESFREDHPDLFERYTRTELKAPKAPYIKITPRI